MRKSQLINVFRLKAYMFYREIAINVDGEHENCVEPDTITAVSIIAGI